MSRHWIAVTLLVLAFPLRACATPRPANDTAPTNPSEIVGEPTYRTVERAPTTDEAPKVPFDPFDPFVELAVSEPEREGVAGEYDVKLEPTAPAFVGDFAPTNGAELAVISASGELAIIGADGEVVARRAIGILDSDVAPRTAHLVDDRVDLVVVHREGADAPRTLSVFRVIGEAVAQVFTAPLEDVTVEFVHRGDERAIRVLHADRADIYRWNRWEGMFRIPRPAPTAPRR